MMTVLGLAKIIQVATETITAGMTVASAWRAANNMIATMIAENRDPTEAELVTLRNDIVDLSARIQDA
jgi:hypothetical protein